MFFIRLLVLGMCFHAVNSSVINEWKCDAWPTSPDWQSRRNLCRTFPEYRRMSGQLEGTFCTCNNNKVFKRNEAEISNSAIEGSPIIVISNRPKSLFRCLLSLLSAVGSSGSPIRVFSQNENKETQLLLQALKIPLRVSVPLQSQYVPSIIAHHYLRALVNTLNDFQDQNYILFLEDDVLVSPDFYKFMNTMAPVLSQDSSLYCVSAHNDIGYPHTTHDPSAALRTESYPNYGWMTERKDAIELARLLKDVPPSVHFYDWDLLAFEYWRQGRECIIPEISRSKHRNVNGTHIGGSLYKRFFERKNYNMDANVSVRGVQKLYQKNYEKELAGMFSRAEFLDAKIFNPCQQKFWNETFNSGKIYVLFFHLPKKKVFQINKDYRLLLQCLKVFSVHPREGHRGLFRLRLGSSHLLLVGYPQSVYSSYRPNRLPIFYYSDQDEHRQAVGETPVHRISFDGETA